MAQQRWGEHLIAIHMDGLQLKWCDSMQGGGHCSSSHPLYSFSRVLCHKIIAWHRLCTPIPHQAAAMVGAGRKPSNIYIYFLTGWLVLIVLTVCNPEGMENG